MKPTKIVCMGDSLTDGWGINIKDRWSNLLAIDLNIECINSGISGDTTGGMLARFDRMALAHQPTHIIIMGGANDLSLRLPFETILSNIQAMTRYARFHEIQAIIGIPPPYFSEEESPRGTINLEFKLLSLEIEKFSTLLRQYAIEGEWPLIDFSKNMEAKHYLEDGMHPNEAGHLVMKNNAKIVVSG